ncbi:MAG: type II secretion system inner membrane protein GspF [Burkholderiaceae bacterium]|nr:type II secretion system inner membrane protein GspF [Burkholderiaceae bacterium]
MPAFRFEAASASGGIERGVIDADSARHARSLLKARGLTPIRVDLLQQVAQAATFSGRLRVGELSLATRQLASLLAARLPVEQALSTVVEQAERRLVRERFSAVRSDVVGGQSFSEALAKYPRDFPEVYRALVSAGEHSGDLAMIMGRLADHIESRSALGQKIMLAFIYPAIVTVVAGLVIVALLAYVVPQVVGVFEQTRQQLPALTVGLIAVSDFVRKYGWWLFGAGVLAFVGFRVALRSPSVRLGWDRRVLRMPLVGRLSRGLNTSRFASTLGILTGAGVPLIRSLEAGAKTLSNEVLKSSVIDSISRVREGAPLARALGASKNFPPMLVHMIASGEATGELPQMLERAATTMSQETERRALAMTSLLEPLLILAMGAVVLLIVLAVMLPIIEINQLVR